MIPIRAGFCFYHDTLNNWYVPVRTWVDATHWASDYSGGMADPGIYHVFPESYYQNLKRTLLRIMENPNLDTIPDFFDMKPSNDNVVIRELPAEEITKGGIIIPPSAVERSLIGEVVFVGPGRYIEQTGGVAPMTAKPGDKVLFDKFAGNELTLEGEKHLIMAERFIQAYY